MKSKKSHYFYDKIDKIVRRKRGVATDRRLNIRMTEFEQRIIQKKANKWAGGNFTLYMLYCAFNHKPEIS